MFTPLSLPYAENALEPHFDTQTMQLHFTKHYQGYIDKLNAALEKYPDLLSRPVEDLLANLADLPTEVALAVRNQGGGFYNHSFFWESLTPQSTLLPQVLDQQIAKHFDSLQNFQEQFSKQALGLFGSGWCWLIQKDDVLQIITTPNQDTPLALGLNPLLGLDVWEHAYYLKYQNRRAEYVQAFWQVINWDKVSSRLK